MGFGYLAQHVQRAQRQPECDEAGYPPLGHRNNGESFNVLAELAQVFLQANPGRKHQTAKADEAHRLKDDICNPCGCDINQNGDSHVGAVFCYFRKSQEYAGTQRVGDKIAYPCRG